MSILTVEVLLSDDLGQENDGGTFCVAHASYDLPRGLVEDLGQPVIIGIASKILNTAATSIGRAMDDYSAPKKSDA